MKEPTTARGWAIFLSKLWGPRFPVDVRQIALDYTQRFTDPILNIVEADVPSFEGALYPLKKKGGWAILFNPTIRSRGRRNFTLAHELGHYLVHRSSTSKILECGQAEVLGASTDTARRQLEHDADQFASYLLMPLDDFRAQVSRQKMSLDLLQHCSDRYEVSSTAAALKWLEFTDRCAVLVVATSGFVLWCMRSKSAARSRLFFPSGMPLPPDSLAAQPALGLAVGSEGIELPPGVWSKTSHSREMAIFADSYEMTISLIEFDDFRRSWDDGEDPIEDAFDRFTKLSTS